ncbi:MAG: hypothetical protein VYB54_07510 [Pseudomonadota bacterium]|nr:hypothetical protein [Pseudomonadota bacterium]
MVDVGAIAAALQAVEHAKQLVLGLADLRDAKARTELEQKFGAAMVEAQAKLLVVLQQEQALIAEKRQLEEEIVRLKAWGAERENYALQAVDRGAFAYVKKPDVQIAEPETWLCPGCYGNAKKSFLQFDQRIPEKSGARGQYNRWVCHVCGYSLSVNYGKAPGKGS